MAFRVGPNSVAEYARRMNNLCSRLPSSTMLEPALRSLVTAFTGTSIELPLRCTETTRRPCRLVEQLPAINEMLLFFDVEARESAPGKIAIRRTPNLFCTDRCYMAYEYAAIFLHCLLARHRCVDSVELDSNEIGVQGVEQLLCDGLQSNNSLTCLRLGYITLIGPAASIFARAVSGLLAKQLRELSLDSIELGGYLQPLLQSLKEGLANAKVLQKLKVVNVGPVIPGPRIPSTTKDVAVMLRDALAANTSLRSLTVDSSVPARVRTFKKILGNNATLAELTVWCVGPDHKANKVFKALLANSSVTRLTIENFNMTPLDGKWFAKLLARNGTLEDVRLEYVWRYAIGRNTEVGRPLRHWPRRRPVSLNVRSLVKALKGACSLRRLSVSWQPSLDEALSLVAAAGECAPLRELHFDCIHFGDLSPFYKGLVDGNAAHKVTIGRCLSNAEHLAPTIRTYQNLLATGVHEPTCGARYLTAEGLALFPADHLTSLVLRGSVTKDAYGTQALATYLASTQRLRELHFERDTVVESLPTLVGGLVRNKSIEKLSIGWKEISTTDMEALSSWLAESRRLYSLGLVFSEWIKIWLMSQMLVWMLEHRYTLIEIAEDDLRWKFPYAQLHLRNLITHGNGPSLTLGEWIEEELEKVLRNFGLVQCAAAFVLGSRKKRAAAAFELVGPWHPQLLDVVRNMGSLSQAEAQMKVAKSSRLIVNEFWQLCGIVKGELRCNQEAGSSTSDDSQPRVQLDQLGVYILDHIRSFLKFTDVLDEAN